MANAITKRQLDVLNAIGDFIAARKYAPSYEEIGRATGLKSLATVHKHIHNLRRKGLLKHVYNSSRSLEVTTVCPACGRGE